MGLFNSIKKAAIFNAVETAYKDNISVYEQEVYKFAKLLDNISDEEQDQYIKRALGAYCKAALNDAIQMVAKAQGLPEIFNFKIVNAIGYPASFGYDDYDFGSTPWAGATYALLIYVVCNETAQHNKCVQLNHYQADLMNQALAKVNAQLK